MYVNMFIFAKTTCKVMSIIYIYIYIYIYKPSRNYDTECSNHHPAQ